MLLKDRVGGLYRFAPSLLKMLDKSKFPVGSLPTPLRVSTAFACTLATLAIQDAHQTAWANPLPEQEPDAEAPSPIAVLPAVAVADVSAPERLTTEAREPSAIASVRPKPDGAAAQSRQWVRISDTADATTEMPIQAIAALSTEPATSGMGQEIEVSAPEQTPSTQNATRPARPLPRIMRDEVESRETSSWVTAPEPVVAETNPVALVPTVAPAPPTLESSAERPTQISQFEATPSPSPVESTRDTSPPVPALVEDDTPSEADILQLREALDGVEAIQAAEEESVDFGNQIVGSPAVTISNPSGYGADNFEGFVGFSYQSRLRYLEEGDASMGVGIGLGDAQRAVGLQLSYTMASFGTKERDFGTGGFNAKLHRQFPGGWSVALGWEGFAEVGSFIEFEDVVYGSVTHIIKTAPDVSDPFSRIAVTAGVGNGRFRSEEQIENDEDAIGVFGSVALRIAQPVSAIVEWTGNDLGVGLSIVPFRNFPLVITPAVRDLAGAGDGARFVVGTGLTFQF